MIVLNSTTDRIQIINGVTASPELQCFASWRDRTSTTFVAGNSLTTTNGASAVDAVTGPPDSSTQRLIDYISIYNPGTSTGNLTVRLNSSGVDYTIYKANIVPGDTLSYNEGDGFSLLSSSGSVRINEIQVVPDIGSGLNCSITVQNYSSPIGASGRQDSMTDLPLYIPLGNNPVVGLGITGASVFWGRVFSPFTVNNLSTGPVFTFNINGVGALNGRVNLLDKVNTFTTTQYRYASLQNFPRATPNDLASQLMVNDYNLILGGNQFNISATTQVVIMMFDTWFSPLPAGGTPSYSTARFNIGGSLGIIPSSTAFGTAQEGTVLYFQRTL